MRHPIRLSLILAASALLACGQKDAPEPASSPPAPAPQANPGPTPAASTTPAAEATETLVFARLPGDREITDKDVTPRLDALAKAGQTITGMLVQETVEDVVDDALLAAEAKSAGFQPPAEATDDEAIAQAFASDKFLAEAKASVTDDDLGAWFAERRGMARIVVADEAAAKQIKSELDTQLSAPGANKLELFLAAKKKLGRHAEVVPDGVLVDVHGKSELGEVLLPEDGAKVLFALEHDGDVSAPSKVGDMWLLIQRIAVRPGTPLAGVPGDQQNAAREKLAARRANDLLDEHVARLRAAIEDTLDQLRKLPFAARKMQLQRHQGQPPRAPMRPAGREIERLMHERAQERVHADE